jgi:hypothetical protein
MSVAEAIPSHFRQKKRIVEEHRCDTQVAGPNVCEERCASYVP